MNYLQKNRSRRTNSRAALILLAIFGVGWMFFYFLGGFILSAVSPLWKAENILTRRLSVLAENENLREQISSLEAQLLNRSALAREESDILRTFGRGDIPEGIAAAVLARPPQTPYDIIVIDAGANESVSPDMEVSLAEGPLLGKVFEVWSSTAKVKLFSNSGVKTSAILERSGLAILLEGAGGGNFRVEVPRETPVERGDRILSADIRSRLLGVVEEIKSEPTDSWKLILARSPANLFNLRFVILR